jgi:hypothetical protein
MMVENSPRLQHRLKIAAYLLIAGLVLEAVTLYWSSPLSFILFAGGAGTLMILGIIVYLIAIAAV